MRQRDKALEAAAACLTGVSWYRELGALEGSRDGHQVGFAIQSGGWDVIVALPHLPVVLGLDRDRWLPSECDADDLDLDDPELGRRFHIHGAPADIVRSALTPALRPRLFALGPTCLSVADRELRLAKRYGYYYAEPDDIAAAIALCTDLACALEHAVASGEAQLLRRARAGAPYRHGPDPDLLRTVRQDRDAELARAAARLRRRRRRRATWTALGLVGAMLWAVTLLTR